MGQALYREYRPKGLAEVVGQEHIITTLRTALKKGAISHAYLFTGPRGVGKTSIARILAHEVNGLPYDEATKALDIIEIDAASNRRIDEIRDLRDKVHIAPASAKYKVYIIDEVHMLTKEAFNALLKTLEEPPAHAIFILATTEVHKLPETIISRTQRFTFKPIERSKAVGHLRAIADKEKITITDGALELIAQHGDGSFRDSISLLDQVSNATGEIGAEEIRQMLGIAPHEVIETLYAQVFGGQPKDILAQLQECQERGYEAGHLAKQLAACIRQKLLAGTLEQPLLATSLLRQLIEVPASSDPETNLEVCLLDINLQAVAPPPAVPVQAAPSVPAPKPAKQASAKVAAPKAAVEAEEKPPKPAAAPKPKAQPPVPSADFAQAWAATLDAVKQQYNTLYGLLRMAQPTYADDTLTLAFKFAFHQKRINDAKNRKLLADLLQERLGAPVAISCIVDKDAPSAPLAEEISSGAPPALPANPADLETISNIFGSAEVLES